MAIRCQPCQAVLGAEVEGVDLRQFPDAATIDVLEEASACALNVAVWDFRFRAMVTPFLDSQ